jgi:hypothetical protein
MTEFLTNEQVEKLKEIAKYARETVELFKKGVPEGIGREETLKRELKTINDLESLMGESLSHWDKDENGQWFLTQERQ